MNLPILSQCCRTFQWASSEDVCKSKDCFLRKCFTIFITLQKLRKHIVGLD